MTDLYVDRLVRAEGFLQKGDTTSALALYREILNENPRYVPAMHMMAVLAFRAGNPDLALNLERTALAVAPDYDLAWYNQALILHSQGHLAEARQAVQQALDLSPELAAAWNLMGEILNAEGGSAAQVGACYERALLYAPDDPNFLGNYAALLGGQGDLVQAYIHARRAEKASKTWPPMILGNTLRAFGYPELAIPCFAKSAALRPDIPSALTSEAMCHLLVGDWDKGFELWEKRLDMEPALASVPFWKGEKADHVVIYEDQGLGDAIQFARYVPWVKEHTDRVTLWVHKNLVRLFALSFPDIEVKAADSTPPAADRRVRLSSLPALAGTQPTTIPYAPYMKADADLTAIWKERLSQQGGGLKIGLVWAGNPRFLNDATRSMTVRQAAEITSSLLGHFVSLQVGQAAPAGVFDATPLLTDFADTAALISALDLIVTVDTAVAHLAGALGKPVFMMTAFDNDWRWLIAREDTPWYPSLRLFRQEKPRDWRFVIDSIKAALQDYAAGDRSVLSPPRWQGGCLRQNPKAPTLPQ